MRGAATVGQLHAIAPWEALLVCHLRLWCDSAEGRNDVRDAWGLAAAGHGGDAVLNAFDRLIQTMTTFSRRPLVRHGRDCECLGADEGIFVQIVSAASEGQLDDAAMVASLIAFPAQAERIAILAAQVGIGFRAVRAMTINQSVANTTSPRRFLH